MKHAYSILVLGLGFFAASHAFAGTTGPADICQTQGPVKVCNKYSYGATFTVTYAGYLGNEAEIGPCKPELVANSNVYMAGYVDGAPIQGTPMVTACNRNGIFSASFGGAGRYHGRIEIYFYDSHGKYDSQYGQNYRFEF